MAKLGEMMDFHFDFWVRNKAPVHLILSQNAFFLYDKDLIQPGLRKLAVLFSSKTGQLKNAYAGNISGKRYPETFTNRIFEAQRYG